jgi:hypothetical protein
VNDLTDFLNFLGSNYVDEWGSLHDISIHCCQVTDLTELISDTTWEYRAMTEIEIGFTQKAVGHTGLMHEAGVPFYQNGSPRYDIEGYALEETGGLMRDEDGSPNRLPLDKGGYPVLPAIAITPTGGRTQTLADLSTGWFEEVHKPEFVERKEK